MPVKPTTTGQARRNLQKEQANAQNQRDRQQQQANRPPKPAAAPRRTPWATGSKKGGWND